MALYLMINLTGSLKLKIW